MTEINPIRLFDLNTQIKDCMNSNFQDPIWVVAEIAQIKENPSGHCYLELIDSNEKNQKIIAQCKAMVWASTWRMMKPYFETTTKQKLSEGMRILIKVKPDFHEVYNFNLIIFDIDPVFTVGDLQIKKNEIIRNLKEDGVFEMNKEIQFPLVPQKIALISSATAAGYGDFTQHLISNQWEYHFQVELFQANMQGEKTQTSIIEALDQIYKRKNEFDVVCIIRGGGAQSDLAIFDNYWIASNVAQFPLPVLTGIGHEQDESVTDMVAYMSLKTPTAVADFLIENVQLFESNLDRYLQKAVFLLEDIVNESTIMLNQLSYKFSYSLNHAIHNENNRILNLSSKILFHSKLKIEQNKNQVSNIQNQIFKTFNQKINLQKNFIESIETDFQELLNQTIANNYSRLNLMQKSALISDPKNILKRGFSITTKNNQIVKDATDLQKGDRLKTEFFHGTSYSEVI